MTDSPSAGWFPDPADATRMRWWDGARWTDHVHPGPEASSASTGTATASTPAQAAPSPPAAHRSRTPLIVSLVAGGFVVLIGVLAAVVWGVVSSASASKYSLADSTFYQLAEKQLRQTVENVPAEPLAHPGAWNLRLSPGYRSAAREYIDEFLADYDAAGQLFDSEDDADEHAYEVASRELADIAQRIGSGGWELPLAVESYPLPEDVVALEEQIAAYPVTAGADGTYWETAHAIAAIVDTELVTDLSLNDCVSLSQRPQAGFFCGSEENWGRVFLTPIAVGSADRPSFVSVVKHELAHKLILLQCTGSYTQSSYAIWSDEVGEGVTNSYAVLFLGANPDELFQDEEYAMTDETYARAQAVHDGDLACFDANEVPPPAE